MCEKVLCLALFFFQLCEKVLCLLLFFFQLCGKSFYDLLLACCFSFESFYDLLSFRQVVQVKRVALIREFEKVCIGKIAEFFQFSGFVFIVQKCGDNIQSP